jgi:hypothetical protein
MQKSNTWQQEYCVVNLLISMEVRAHLQLSMQTTFPINKSYPCRSSICILFLFFLVLACFDFLFHAPSHDIYPRSLLLIDESAIFCCDNHLKNGVRHDKFEKKGLSLKCPDSGTKLHLFDGECGTHSWL